MSTPRVLIGKKNASEYGLWVSKPGTDVTDDLLAQGGNLSFDSSERALASLRVLQTGTFQIQCKKTFMGKKGALEIGSDEQLRANADYTKRYPFELDTISTHEEYYSTLPKNSNVAMYGFGEGEVPFTGNAINHQYVQNVYCDYGTQTIEFNPPLPQHIKTPFISVFFAVGDSQGNFHPWYANVVCGDSEYEWSYANSQHCVHMDSAWFRGKWTFRERTIAPLGHDVNVDFPEQFDGEDGRFFDYLTTGAFVGDARRPSGYERTDARFVESAPSYVNAFPNKDEIISGQKYPVVAGYGAAKPVGFNPKVGRAGSLTEPLAVDLDLPTEGRQYEEVAGAYGNYGRQNEILAQYNEISFNVGDTDLHSPSSLWGGMLKSFAGLQGLTYYANSTHLKLDAFMTPTHTPTPFETEIVKTREETSPGSGEYKEVMPRMFRTKYWDGSQTEFEWWPIGHANGYFTIANGVVASTGTPVTTTRLKQMLANEAEAMFSPSPYIDYGTVSTATLGPFSYDPLMWGTATKIYDGTGGNEGGFLDPASKYISAVYGDYRIIKELGRNPEHRGTPHLTLVNKGTRFPNQLSDTEARTSETYSQYEPGDAFLKTRTFQGQPTSLDSFWNSFSNNTSQWVSANTPYGEFYYADGGYALDYSTYWNYQYVGKKPTIEVIDGTDTLIKIKPSSNNIQRQSFAKHNWNGGNPKAGVGTEGKRFGFGGAGSQQALGGSSGVFDTYYGKYIVYDIEGAPTDE